jgi:signal transduction histidine kinase
MNSKQDQDLSVMTDEYREIYYGRHVRGAMVRSVAGLIMWSFGLIIFLLGTLKSDNFMGISASVAFLVLINPPTLWVLKHARKIRTYKIVSLTMNTLEIIGVTAIIYFLGGIEASNLLLLYAALIIYTGLSAPPILPFILASICSMALSLMVVLVHLGFLPYYTFTPGLHYPWKNQLTILSTSIALLFVVACIASYTAKLLGKNRERLRRQNEIYAASDQYLQNEIAERELAEAKLIVAKKGAEAASRAKSDFLANMSHELRTPLNHIIGFTELVVDRQCGDLNKVQEEYLKDVLLSSRDLQSLINDILDFSKLEAGKLDLEVGDIHLRRLLEGSLDKVKEKALKHRIRLFTEMNGIPEVIQGDERKLKQILYNLLSNAVKFTPDGGVVTLAACRLFFQDAQWRSEDGRVEPIPLVPSAAGEWVKFSVRDTGIGLKAEDLERVFAPFEQADNSVSRKYQGTGLGLSLTKRLVELHGGKIWAESQGLGMGSVFQYLLPLAAS